MDFQKYINHADPIQQYKPIQNYKNTITKPRIIKFIGNMQDNIKQLLIDLQCNCGVKKQFYNILMVFGNKIQKLRKQREHYKNTLKEYLVTLEQKNMNNNNQNVKKQQKGEKFQYSSQVDKIQFNFYQNKQNLFKTAEKKKDRLSEFIQQKYDKKQKYNIKNLTAIKNTKAPLYLQFTNYKQNNTVDNKLKQLQSKQKYQPYEIHHTHQNNNEDGQFSFNLSSFQQGEKETTDFMKEMSSIMSQTNLLDSDTENDQVIQNNLLKDDDYEEEQAKKLKMLKQSNNLNIHNLLRDKQNNNFIKPPVLKQPKKKQSSAIQNILSKDINLKKIKFSSTNQQNKQNKQTKKVQTCLKKYNICLQKLQDFIQKKQCLKQLQKGQHLYGHLGGLGGLSAFRTVNSCTLEKNTTQKNIKVMGNMQPLQERKFNFNL